MGKANPKHRPKNGPPHPNWPHIEPNADYWQKRCLKLEALLKQSNAALEKAQNDLFLVVEERDKLKGQLLRAWADKAVGDDDTAKQN